MPDERTLASCGCHCDKRKTIDLDSEASEMTQLKESRSSGEEDKKGSGKTGDERKEMARLAVHRKCVLNWTAPCPLFIKCLNERLVNTLSSIALPAQLPRISPCSLRLLLPVAQFFPRQPIQ